MHDIRWIRENPAAFDAALARRGLPGESAKLLEIDEKRRVAIGHLERALARRNAASKEIGEAKRRKDEAHAEDLMTEVSQLKVVIPELEKTPRELEAKLNGILASIPNLPSAEVPDGKDEHDNVEHHHFGAKKNYPFTPKQHFELGEDLRQMDFETAAKLSGARFVVLKSGLARMERAIGQFFVDVHTTEHGYTEIAPPLLVTSNVMYGTAQLPKFEEDQFYALSSLIPNETLAATESIRGRLLEMEQQEESSAQEATRLTQGIEGLLGQGPEQQTIANLISAFRTTFQNKIQYANEYIAAQRQYLDLLEPMATRKWLIPTAEVPLTNLVRESIVDEAELPMRLTAYTPCFRAEAGAAGKDTRGMIRQHQFNKVELVSITTPEQSKDEHERMLACAEEVLRRLGLHYRVVTLCTGDMGFASQKTYDIEVWLPGQGMYREISSCSNCGDFQARRMDARFRGKTDRTPRFVHTLNGSGVAVGRALIAVMENYQDEGGKIAVPDVLQPYMGGMKAIEKVQ